MLRSSTGGSGPPPKAGLAGAAVLVGILALGTVVATVPQPHAPLAPPPAMNLPGGWSWETRTRTVYLDGIRAFRAKRLALHTELGSPATPSTEPARLWNRPEQTSCQSASATPTEPPIAPADPGS